MEKEYTLSVVTIKKHIRCVYVNDYRLVGGKPYVSEPMQTQDDFDFTLNDLRSAFPELEINPKPSKESANE